jgi:hypothetical protein
VDHGSGLRAGQALYELLRREGVVGATNVGITLPEEATLVVGIDEM